MKILKHGEMYPRKFTCTRCHCEFVADQSEYGTHRNEHPYGGTLYYVTCPDCYHDMRVRHYDAPLYEEPVDEHVDKGCDSLMDFYKKKKEWYKIMHDILETMEELDNESKTDN